MALEERRIRLCLRSLILAGKGGGTETVAGLTASEFGEERNADGHSYEECRACELLLWLDVDGNQSRKPHAHRHDSNSGAITKSALGTAAILGNVFMMLASPAPLCRAKVFIIMVASQSEGHTLWQGAIVPVLHNIKLSRKVA